MNIANLTKEVASEFAAVAATATHFCPSCGISAGYKHSPSCDVLTSALAAQTPSFVQGANAVTGNTGSLNSVQIIVPNQTVGNTNIVGVFFADGTTTITGITDSNNTSYTRASGPIVQSAETMYLYYGPVTSSLSQNAITIAFSASTTFRFVLAAEYYGIAPTNALDATGSGSGASGTAISAAVTTTNANDIVIGFTVGGGSGLGLAGQNQRISVAGASIGMEDILTTSTGTTTMTWTATSGVWLMIAAAFRSGLLSQRYPTAILHA